MSPRAGRSLSISRWRWCAARDETRRPFSRVPTPHARSHPAFLPTVSGARADARRAVDHLRRRRHHPRHQRNAERSGDGLPLPPRHHHATPPPPPHPPPPFPLQLRLGVDHGERAADGARRHRRRGLRESGSGAEGVRDLLRRLLRQALATLTALRSERPEVEREIEKAEKELDVEGAPRRRDRPSPEPIHTTPDPRPAKPFPAPAPAPDPPPSLPSPSVGRQGPPSLRRPHPPRPAPLPLPSPPRRPPQRNQEGGRRGGRGVGRRRAAGARAAGVVRGREIEAGARGGEGHRHGAPGERDDGRHRIACVWPRSTSCGGTKRKRRPPLFHLLTTPPSPSTGPRAPARRRYASGRVSDGAPHTHSTIAPQIAHAHPRAPSRSASSSSRRTAACSSTPKCAGSGWGLCRATTLLTSFVRGGISGRGDGVEAHRLWLFTDRLLFGRPEKELFGGDEFYALAVRLSATALPPIAAVPRGRV